VWENLVDGLKRMAIKNEEINQTIVVVIKEARAENRSSEY